MAKANRNEFKKVGDELQEFLAFRKRGGKVAAKKGKGSQYNRAALKRGDYDA